MSNSRLGKGLEALIRSSEDQLGSGVTSIPISSISPNPHQPRKQFEKKPLDELTASIKEKGVLTPVTVYKAENEYVLVAGERRWRASQQAGLKEIPAYVVSVTGEKDVMEMALVENIQRENLNAIEEAEAYAYLNSKFNLSHTAIAKAVGKNRSTVSNSLRLLSLPNEIKESIQNGKISAGHGRSILTFKTEPEMIRFWNKILIEKTSVRAAEELVKEKPEKSTVKKKQKVRKISPLVKSLEDELITLLKTKVRIHADKESGKIEVSYFSNDDLERIMDLLRTVE